MTKGNEWRETKNLWRLVGLCWQKRQTLLAKGQTQKHCTINMNGHTEQNDVTESFAQLDCFGQNLCPLEPYTMACNKKKWWHTDRVRLGAVLYHCVTKAWKLLRDPKKNIVIAPTKTFKGGHRLHQTWIKINIVQSLVVKPGLTFLHKNGWSRSLVALPSGLETFSTLANIAPDRTNWTLWPRNKHHSVDKKT